MSIFGSILDGFLEDAGLKFPWALPLKIYVAIFCVFRICFCVFCVFCEHFWTHFGLICGRCFGKPRPFQDFCGRVGGNGQSHIFEGRAAFKSVQKVPRTIRKHAATIVKILLYSPPCRSRTSLEKTPNVPMGHCQTLRDYGPHQRRH